MSTTRDGTSGASGIAVQQAAGLLGSEVREGYAEIGDVRLHYVEAGEGPLIVLLHGFPSSGTAGACRSSRSRRRDSGSSRPALPAKNRPGGHPPGLGRR
jgi:hypothetical protein